MGSLFFNYMSELVHSWHANSLQGTPSVVLSLRWHCKYTFTKPRLLFQVKPRKHDFVQKWVDKVARFQCTFRKQQPDVKSSLLL